MRDDYPKKRGKCVTCKDRGYLRTVRADGFRSIEGCDTCAVLEGPDRDLAALSAFLTQMDRRLAMLQETLEANDWSAEDKES